MSPARFGLGVSNCRSAQGVVDAVVRAEEAGAEIAFIAEDVNCRDAFLLAGLSAQATARIRLGTGVVNPYTRNPTSLAMAAATLDEVSGGRALLGLGSSSPSLIHDQMGIPHVPTLLTMREATIVIRALLAGDAVTYAGSRYRYREARLEARPIQQVVPIYFAAMGPQMLRLAGELADGVLLNVGASPEYVRWAVAEIAAGAAAARRDPADITVAAWLSTYISDDRASALQSAREWLAGMLSIPRQGELLLEHAGGDLSILEGVRRHYRAYPHAGDKVAAARHVPEDVAERMALVGSREAVLARVATYREAGLDVPVFGPSAVTALFS